MRTIDSADALSGFFKKIYQNELSSIAIKVFFAVILTSAIVISLVRISTVFHIFLAPYEYGLIIELISLAAISALSILVLFILLKKPKEKPIKNIQYQPLVITYFWNLTSRFSDGFAKGLEREQVTSQVKSIHHNS